MVTKAQAGSTDRLANALACGFAPRYVETMAPNFLQALRSGCQRFGAPSGRWLIAVSGGADSVALLRGLAALRPEFGWELTVAHFDHRLRGPESTADAVWVGQLAYDLNLPIRIGAAAEPATARDEETARLRRYAFLEQTARETGCSIIATAHTADDQAETVLHHLLRGTGLAGLRGIPLQRRVGSVSDRSPNELTIVRPMLGITRAQVLEYLESLGQDYRRDSTNVDVKLTRNWLRHQVLPELRARWPHVAESLCRLAEQAEEVSAAVSHLARELLAAALVDDGPDVARLSVTPLVDRPRHLVRQVVVELWRDRDWPLQEMTTEHWNRVADLVQGEGAATLPGAIEARRRGALLVFQRRPKGDALV
jgi:tRNA(Ile)-lysidine synthase